MRRTVVLVALLVACGDSTAPPPSPDASTETPSSVAPDCSDLTDAVLAYVRTCSCIPDAVAAAKRFQNECELVRLSPGAVGVATALDACARAVRAATASCDGVGVACTVAPGTRAVGEACGADAQCASGTCGSAAGPGGSLIDSVPPGMLLGFTTSGTCGTCSAPSGFASAARQLLFPPSTVGCCKAHALALGEACDLRCPDYGACADPLVCDGKTCVQPIASGAMCNGCSSYACARGTSCSGDCTAVAAGTCTPGAGVTQPLADGAACAGGQTCDVYAQCLAGSCAFFDPRTCN